MKNDQATWKRQTAIYLDDLSEDVVALVYRTVSPESKVRFRVLHLLRDWGVRTIAGIRTLNIGNQETHKNVGRATVDAITKMQQVARNEANPDWHQFNQGSVL